MATTNNQSGRRYMENGRIVVRSTKFSWYRALFVLSPALVLWCSNPTNEVFVVPENRVYTRKVTNYGFFSVKERYNRLSFFIAGFELECPFQDAEVGPHCLNLNNILTHQKPLIWEPSDRPYTTHRIICWTLVTISLLATCWLPPRNIGIESLDALLTVFVDAHTEWPIFNLPLLLLQADLFLYPTWSLLDNLIPIQSEQSLFRVFPEPSYNYVWCVALMFGTAAFFTSLAKHYGNTKLGFQAVVALCMGYYRATHHDTSSTSKIMELDLNHLLSSPIMLTWVMLCLIAVNESLQTALIWFAVNVSGFIMGNYQMENIGVGAAFAATMKGLKDMFFDSFTKRNGL